MSDVIAPFGFLTAGQIIFGRGAREQAAARTAKYGTCIALVRGKSVAWVDVFKDELRTVGVTVHEVSCTQEPSLPMISQALDGLRPHGVDAVVAIGGGAVIDMGKALAALLPASGDPLTYLESVGQGQPLDTAPVPFVAIPTTSGTGAELTKNAVILVPEAGRKVSLRDDRMLPDLALVDPELTDGCPRSVTLASGLDAITQVIEPYLCNKSSPLTDALCRDAIPKGLAAIFKLAQGEDADARDAMSYTSMIGGMALANAGLGAVHGLAGVLGGRVLAPHGLVCGRLLGPVLMANHAKMTADGQTTARFDEVASWMEAAWELPRGQVFENLSGLLDDWGVPRLGEWVTAQTPLEPIAEEASGSSSMKANPCILSHKTLIGIMKQAI